MSVITAWELLFSSAHFKYHSSIGKAGVINRLTPDWRSRQLHASTRRLGRPDWWSAFMSKTGPSELRRALFDCVSLFRTLDTLAGALRLTWEYKDRSCLNIDEINRLADDLGRGQVFRTEDAADGVRELWVNHPAADNPSMFSVRHPGAYLVSFSDTARQTAQENLTAWLDLMADKTTKPPEPTAASKPRKVQRDKLTEARDKWVYDQCWKGVAYDSIARNLPKKNPKWNQIITKQGILACAKRYAKRNGLPDPPPRQEP